MTATSELRLFKHSLCCCSLAFCSWFSLFLSWINSRGGGKQEEGRKNTTQTSKQINFQDGDRGQETAMKRETFWEVKSCLTSKTTCWNRLYSPEIIFWKKKKKCWVISKLPSRSRLSVLSLLYLELNTAGPALTALRNCRALLGARARGFLPIRQKATQSTSHPPHYLQLLVQAVELSYSRLVVVVAINPAVLQHLQLPGEFLYLWDRQHQLTLLLLEQAVHLFNLLHWRGRESTIAALRNGPAWAASKAARQGHRSAGCCKPVAPGKTALSWGSWTSKLGSKAIESLSAQSTQAELLNSHNAKIPQNDAHSNKANAWCSKILSLRQRNDR